ncbi:MAG: hypothetical protein ACKVP7_07185 [Hyphomicrobiaceae bacterium]
MKKIVLASALALAAMTSVAGAYERYGSGSQREIDARQSNQETRIQQGLRSGDLTRREAAALEAEQARIRALERNAQRDGRIDGREAAQIRRAQDEASRHIYQERHDSERRGDGWRNRRWW